MNNIFLLSIPRSGSTWLSRAISRAYNLNLLDEPFRRSFGRQGTEPLFHSNVLSEEDFRKPDFWRGFSDFSRSKPATFFEWANKQNNLIIKETSGLFQTGFLMKALPRFDFVFLRRHLGAVLDSHIRIPNVFTAWNYQKRINTLKAQVSDEYINIYKRAESAKIRGEMKWALLLAHLAVQEIEGMRRIANIIEYEQIVVGRSLEVLPTNIFPKIPICKTILNEEEGSEYLLHGTKNPVDPYAWVEKYSKSDLENIRYILGEWFDSIFPKVTRTTYIPQKKAFKTRTTIKEPEELPALEYVEVPYFPGRKISNRLVTVGEYTALLNACLDAGIEDVCERLCSQELNLVQSIISKGTNTIVQFKAKNPKLPMTFVSPLAALATCRFMGGILPRLSTYEAISRRFDLNKISSDSVNYGEYIGRPTQPGLYPRLNGLYDVFGNLREFCIDDSLRIFAIGGSYRDDFCDLRLQRKAEFPYMISGSDVGFRVETLDNSKKRDVIEIIKNARDPLSLFKTLIDDIS